MRPILLFTCICYCIIIIGCAPNPVLPTYRIQPPWNRILTDGSNLSLNATLSIKVTGETTPLIGNEELTEKQIKDLAQQLLERRGFRISDNIAQYEVAIKYKTTKEIKNYSYQNTTQSSTSINAANSLFYMGKPNYGIGVLIAQAVISSQVQNLSNSTTSMNFDIVSYYHVLAVEIYDTKKALIWKSDANWNSLQLDILPQTIVAFQTVFSSLPSDNSLAPNVPKLKNNRFSDYFTRFMYGKRYNSPALPYNIRFNLNQKANGKTFVQGINTTKELLAFIDLLQTAEFALPDLKESDWKDPLNPEIWKNVTLGGQYTLGRDNEKINILINLQSEFAGYVIMNCKVVSDEEYNQFMDKLNRWKQVLNDYYDFFE